MLFRICIPRLFRDAHLRKERLLALAVLGGLVELLLYLPGLLPEIVLAHLNHFLGGPSSSITDAFVDDFVLGLLGVISLVPP